LLDFGIARLLAPDIFHRPFDPTITILRAATPRYASPEQISGGVITTASDVYSLGVLLYELLSGRSPYNKPDGLTHEVAKAVLEDEPEKPSRAVQRTEGIGSKYGFIPNSFRLRLEGDLDNIILKALNKEPAQRYLSVDAFAQDIRNFLEDRPVAARTPTWNYVISKFVYRYPWQVGAAAAAVAVLIGGSTALAWQAQIAERRFDEGRKLANSLVSKLEPALQKISGTTSARKLVVQEAISYLNALSKEAGDDPELQGEIASSYEHWGVVQGSPAYSNLGDIQGGLASFRKALAIRRSLAARNPGDAKLQDSLATCLYKFSLVNLATGRIQETIGLQREALTIRKKLYEADPSAYLEKLLSDYDGIGRTQLGAGDPEQAEKNFRMELTLAERQMRLAPQSEKAALNIWYVNQNLAQAFSAKGNPGQALVYAKRELEVIEQLSQKNPTNIMYQKYLANSYSDIAQSLGNPEKPNIGDWQAALTYYKKALQISIRLAKDDPADMDAQDKWSLALQSIGHVLAKYGSLSEALYYSREALKIRQKLARIDQLNAFTRWYLAVGYHSIGNVLLLQHKMPNALENFTHALQIRRTLFEKNPTDLEAKYLLAQTLLRMGEAHEKLAQKGRSRTDKKLDWSKARDAYWQVLELQLPTTGQLHLEASQGLQRCLSSLHLLQENNSFLSNNLSEGISIDAQK
jgi:eukaryotic-like serine/threonine-protein kinase